MEALLVFIPFAIYVIFWVKFGDHRTTIEKDSIKYKTGVDLLEKKQFDQALAYFEAVTTQNRKSAFAWLMKGKVNVELKNFNTAYFCFEQSIIFDNTNPESFFHKAKMLYSLGFYEEAITELNKTSWFYKDKNAEIFYWMALVNYKLKKISEVNKYLQTSAALGNERANVVLISQNFQNLRELE